MILGFPWRYWAVIILSCNWDSCSVDNEIHVTVCGGVLSPTPAGVVGHITTPNYNETVDPDGSIRLTGQYPPNTQCEWSLQGGPTVNSSIVLKFEPNRFKLEHDGECRYDFLRIHEGEHWYAAARQHNLLESSICWSTVNPSIKN